MPSAYSSSNSTILTGSSDGLLRAVQLFPTKLLGVVVDHGSFPIERIAIDRGGEGHWVGSVGHDEKLRLTDLREVFEGSDGEEEEEEEEEEEGEDKEGSEAESDDKNSDDHTGDTNESDEDSEKSDSEDSSSSEEEVEKKRRKKQKVVDPLGVEKRRRKKARNDEVRADPSFFADL